MSENVRKELADYWQGNGEYAMSYDSTAKSVDLFLSRNIVIPRSELPEASTSSTRHKTVSVDGELWTIEGVWENPLRWRDKALNYLTIAEYLESDAAKEAEKNAARDKRRDEVLAELAHEAADANNYMEWDKLSVVSRRAIDRIIDLEVASNV